MRINEIVEQNVGAMATTQVEPGEPIALGFRWGDTESYVRARLETLPDSRFIRPIFHRGNLIGISIRPPRDTRELQNFLNTQGYTVTVDGAWGPQTNRALEDYFNSLRTQLRPMSDLLRGVQ